MPYQRSWISQQFAEWINAASRRDARPQHIVDTLIAERGENIVHHPAWPVLRPLLFEVLHYRQAVRMADAIAPLSGFASLGYLSSLLELAVTPRGTHNIPATGGFVLVSNHPTGIADGIALFDALSPVRPDLAIFANRDAIRVNARFADVIIPVEWRAAHKSQAKSRQTLLETSRAINNGKAIVIFPSGRIAFWADGHLNERPWQVSALALARRYDLPVLPVNITGRNSGLFYWLANWSTELRDMTVFHELLNKKRMPFSVTFGEMIPQSALQGDLPDLTGRLQLHCAETLATDPQALFS